MERAFNPERKTPPWGRRKLRRDPSLSVQNVTLEPVIFGDALEMNSIELLRLGKRHGNSQVADRTLLISGSAMDDSRSRELESKSDNEKAKGK